MKSAILYLLCFSLIILSSCEKDEGDPVTYDYHAHIMQPSSSDKQMGDVLFIQVEFESHTGEDVEHINIKLRKADNSAVVYNKPFDPHIGEVSDYEYTDTFDLTTANGVGPGDWVLEATVWGADEGQDQVTEIVTFHIHP